jgi:hypothetical protein
LTWITGARERRQERRGVEHVTVLHGFYFDNKTVAQEVRGIARRGVRVNERVVFVKGKIDDALRQFGDARIFHQAREMFVVGVQDERAAF